MQNPNPIIQDFRSRVIWIVENMNPDPTYRRFISPSDINDVHTAFLEACKDGTFPLGHRERVLGQRTWNTALNQNNVPKIYLRWLCYLFPDLEESHLTCENLTEFLKLGESIKLGRDRWMPAIELMTKKRHQLAEIAKKFYREFDTSNDLKIDGVLFPLITQKGWIRSRPMPLRENTENKYLTLPDPFVDFHYPQLSGLRGGYVAYKGALAYSTRRPVKPEPQHNGEIFCAKEVIFEENEFIGFKYNLGRYFDYINTCEVLGAELAKWVLSNPNNDELNQLEHRGAAKNAFNLTERASYPGINCLTVLLNYSESDAKDPDNYFLIHKRDETQLQAQNTIHVVPAGGHQGFAKGAMLEDTAMFRTMLREFAEELFDLENLYKQPESWDQFLLYKNVKKIKHVFFDGNNPAAKAYLHGFGLDPVTLKPEVLITIVIDWKNVRSGWHDAKLKFNWELQSKTGIRAQFRKLSRNELLRQATGGVETVNDITLKTLPAGSACMLLTALHYNTLGLTGKDLYAF